MSGQWKEHTDKLPGIWYPSRNHKDGYCDVDSDWFHPSQLEDLLKQFPQPKGPTIHIPEEVKIETDISSNTFIFKGGIPTHFYIHKPTMRDVVGRMIFFKREESNGPSKT